MYLQLHPRAVCYRKGKEGLSPESKTGSLATFSLRVSGMAICLTHASRVFLLTIALSLDTSLVDDLVKHVHTRGFFLGVGVKEAKPGKPYS